MLRAAKITDVPAIQGIISSHAGLGKMLFKSFAQLYENLRDFAVYDIGTPESPRVVGCVALSIIWADLAEVRSLAVDREHIGRGIGKQLVLWCVEEARRVGIRKLMALTYEETFFRKLGFEVVEKESLPLKVWTDCVKCPKQNHCDEIAVIRELLDVPHVMAPTAIPTPRGVSIPVLDYSED